MEAVQSDRESIEGTMKTLFLTILLVVGQPHGADMAGVRESFRAMKLDAKLGGYNLKLARIQKVLGDPDNDTVIDTWYDWRLNNPVSKGVLFVFTPRVKLEFPVDRTAISFTQGEAYECITSHGVAVVNGGVEDKIERWELVQTARHEMLHTLCAEHTTHRPDSVMDGAGTEDTYPRPLKLYPLTIKQIKNGRPL